MSNVIPHLSNPPLTLAITKVEFNTLTELQLDAVIESFSDRIRSDYPSLTQGEVRSLEMEINPDDMPSKADLKHLKSKYWLFKNESLDWSIRLDKSSIFIATSKYISSDDMCDRVATLLLGLKDTGKVTHTRFIGTRFINYFEPDENGEFSNYSEQFNYIQRPLPFAEAMGGSRFQSRYKVEDYWLDIKCDIVVFGSPVPDDLYDVAQSVNMSTNPLNKVFSTLDLDCKYLAEQYEKFDSANVRTHILELTTVAKKALYHALATKEIEARKDKE